MTADMAGAWETKVGLRGGAGGVPWFLRTYNSQHQAQTISVGRADR